jgi:hypothetical protein
VGGAHPTVLVEGSNPMPYYVVGRRTVIAFLVANAVASAASPPVSVRLVAPRTDYLVGEPVLLDVVVRNISDSKLAAYNVGYDGYEHITEIFISKREKFNKFLFNEFTCLEPSVYTLGPGESSNNPVRLLFGRAGRKRPAGLAFAEPGTFTVKVVYPLLLVGDQRVYRIESNPVQVTINAPVGADNEVWRRIRSPEVFDFLQFDDGPEQERAVVKIVEALRASPGSRYKASFEPALRRFFERREDLLAPADRRKIRELLDVPESDLFPEDERLDAVVQLESANAPIGVFLESLSRQSRVRLSASGEVGMRSWHSSRQTAVLRNEMESLSQCMKASWKRHGSGYVLSREP